MTNKAEKDQAKKGGTTAASEDAIASVQRDATLVLANLDAQAEDARLQVVRARRQQEHATASLATAEASLEDILQQRSRVQALLDRTNPDKPIDVSAALFGVTLRNRRQDSGMSRAELAKVVGVSVPTIQNWETGAKRISPENMDVLAAALATVPDDLWPGWSKGEREGGRPLARREPDGDILTQVLDRLTLLDARLAALEAAQEGGAPSDLGAAARAGARAARAGRQQSESTPAPSQPSRRARS